MASGNIVITDSWPGQMRTVWGDHQRFFDNYLSACPGKYFSGSGCRRDEDGNYLITGRVEAIINLSLPHGHGRGRERLGPPRQRRRAAVVGYPDDVKDRGIYAYVTLNVGG